MCNGVKLTSFNYYTHDLKVDNHKELRKSGLLMHLQDMRNVLAGEESMSNPVSCVEVTCAAYLSLHKYYLHYKRSYGYIGCNDWEFYDTTKVQCMDIYTYVRMYLKATNCLYISFKACPHNRNNEH